MGKKRQKDKTPRQEDDDADLAGPSCSHIRKSIDRSFLKKTGGESSLSTCQDCKDEEQGTGEDGDASTIWMCLKCGHRGCGRHSENQHAIRHFEKPHSDPHCLVVNLDSWNVWCYICDDDVQYSRTGNVAQLITNLKKQALSEPGKRTPQKNIKMESNLVEEAQEIKTELVKDKEEKVEKEKVEEDKVLQETVQEEKVQEEKVEEAEVQEEKVEEAKVQEEKVEEAKVQEEKVEEAKVHKESVVNHKKVKKDSAVKPGATGAISAVKGLSNLGNTCFFNAVVQNLSQTRLLRQTLNTLVEEKTSLTITPGISSDLEPILVQLEKPGSLTLTMCQLLNEIQETKKGVVTPRELFTQVCKKAARFKGFQQQDSQELLRYLLDGMRAEEIKRVSSGMLEALKKSGEDAEQSKTLIKEYEKNGAYKNFVDQVFGGEMTSTVMCLQCQTVSSVTDKFLDLSLSVSDEAYKKKNQKKGPQRSSETSQEGGDSPVQLTNGNDDDMPTGSKYQQKKAKKQAKKQAKNQRRLQKVEGKPTLDDLIAVTTPADQAEHGENGSAAEDQRAETDVQEGDQARAGAEQSKPGDEEDSAVDCEPEFSTTVVSERFAALSKGPQGTDDRLSGDHQPSKVVHDGEEAEELSIPTEEEDQLVEGLESMSLDTAFIVGSEGSGEEMANGEGPVEAPAEAKEYTVVNQDPELVFHTLATRTVPEKQECSVQSCLFQFTEVETLTQNNSLLCATCTKRQASSRTSDGSKKNVYTDALKQMLISSAPPVLTLHLKRFQQVGYSLCKVNRHVTFPQVLDLAPFCAVNGKGVVEGEDNRVLYSLYGIVEHSGTMRSGHYIAYVRTQPLGPSALQNGAPAQGEAETSRGSWFHVSDSSVHPVPERQVQSSQAYLLFYERTS